MRLDRPKRRTNNEIGRRLFDRRDLYRKGQVVLDSSMSKRREEHEAADRYDT